MEKINFDFIKNEITTLIRFKFNQIAFLIEIIDNLNLPEDMEENKGILKARFLDEVNYYENKRDKTKKFYNVFRFIVTTGSILLPAILSIGQMDPNKLPKNLIAITSPKIERTAPSINGAPGK